jgi:hypothetical protein
MRAKSRRVMNTGERVGEQAHANPGEDPRFLGLLTQLDGLNLQAKASAAAQRDGITQVRGATALKQSIQAEIRATHLPHLARVADHLAAVAPELEPALRLRGDARTIQGFLTTTNTIVAAAQAHRPLLVEHGLVESLLDDLVVRIDRFGQAVLQGVEGRRQHVGASAELQRITSEIRHVVRVMDGFQRLRFAKDPEQLAAWISASSLPTPARGEDPVEAEPVDGGAAAPGSVPAAGDVRPAA